MAHLPETEDATQEHSRIVRRKLAQRRGNDGGSRDSHSLSELTSSRPRPTLERLLAREKTETLDPRKGVKGRGFDSSAARSPQRQEQQPPSKAALERLQQWVAHSSISRSLAFGAPAWEGGTPALRRSCPAQPTLGSGPDERVASLSNDGLPFSPPCAVG